MDVADLAPDPFDQFRIGSTTPSPPTSLSRPRWRWPPPTASGRPSVRFVLLKGVDATASCSSRTTGAARATSWPPTRRPRCCFGWIESSARSRVVGPVARSTRAESDAYFATRAARQPVGAWASDQSRADRRPRRARARWAEAEARFDGAPCRVRRTGAGTGSCPTRSSSGRAGPAASTTASATAGSDGWPNVGCRIERAQVPLSGHSCTTGLHSNAAEDLAAEEADVVEVVWSSTWR